MSRKAKELLKAQKALKDEKPAEAQELLNRALAIEPRLTAARLTLAACLDEVGRHAEALAETREAVELDPSRAESWDARASALAESDEVEAGSGRQAVRVGEGDRDRLVEA